MRVEDRCRFVCPRCGQIATEATVPFVGTPTCTCHNRLREINMVVAPACFEQVD